MGHCQTCIADNKKVKTKAFLLPCELWPTNCDDRNYHSARYLLQILLVYWLKGNFTMVVDSKWSLFSTFSMKSAGSSLECNLSCGHFVIVN